MQFMQFASELVKLSIVSLVFGLGLRLNPNDLPYLFRPPRILLRALFAVAVVVPITAVTLAVALGVPPHVPIAIALLAVSPGAPFIPQRELKIGGRSELFFGLATVTALLAIVIVPSSLAILGLAFLEEASVAVAAVARLVSILFLLPLSLGMILRRIAPEAMEWLSGPMIFGANALLGLVVVYVVVQMLPSLLSLGVPVTLTLIGVSGTSLFLGHMLGGPRAADRTALALMCSDRHPALALLIATANFANEAVLPVIVAYLLISTTLTIPYLVWRNRVARVQPATIIAHG